MSVGSTSSSTMNSPSHASSDSLSLSEDFDFQSAYLRIFLQSNSPIQPPAEEPSPEAMLLQERAVIVVEFGNYTNRE